MLKAQCVFHFAMIEQLFKRAKVRRRMAAGQLGITLAPFVLSLHSRGYSLFSVQSYVRIVERFGLWLKQGKIATRHINEAHQFQFLRHHLPRCRCPKPASKSVHQCRAALNLFFAFLREGKLIVGPSHRVAAPTVADRLMVAYDQHLSQVRGLSVSPRRARQHYARQFLEWRFGRRPPGLLRLRPKDVAGYVNHRARDLSLSGIHDLTVGLRSFLGFLEFSGRIGAKLSGSVAHPVQRPAYPLAKVLDWNQWKLFLKSFPRHTPTGRRDYAIALCLSLLALRVGEVIALSLDDLNWREMTLRLAQTKQQRQRLLPLPPPLAQALAKYLQHGRPSTRSRALFVCHRPPVGEPLKLSRVRGVIRRAFARAGIDATGTHILRHTWATWAHRRGASLKLIADVLGHRS